MYIRENLVVNLMFIIYLREDILNRWKMNLHNHYRLYDNFMVNEELVFEISILSVDSIW